jgi:hypothetical protein
MSLSLTKAAVAQKPVLLRQWFFARVFAWQAKAQAAEHPAAARRPSRKESHDHRPRGDQTHHARRGKLARAA